MSLWNDIFERVKSKLGNENIFFRGHSDSNWKLKPSIGRIKGANTDLETNLYFQFVTQAGSLLPEQNSCWNNVFAMQHHGLPTRLLDWTESFAVALYFALKGANKQAAVWLLNPYCLNEESMGLNYLFNPSDLKSTYYNYFIEPTVKMEGDIIAIAPLRHNPRVYHQKSGFTLHRDLKQPLEKLHPKAVEKIIIPKRAFADARYFLQMSGITEFSLFPDLDGLAREIKTGYQL